MPGTATERKPSRATSAKLRHEDMYQVVLHNDDKNTMDHVIACLMRVFGHPMELAVKIMLEAHLNGKAIAEVEGEDDAKLHKDQLQSYSLTATIEKV